MILLQRLVEKAFIVFAMLFHTGAVSFFIANTNPAYQGIRLCAFGSLAVTIFLIAARWKRVVRIISKEKLLWVLVLMVMASVFWSDMVPIPDMLYSEYGPGNGIVPFLNITLCGVYFATRYSLKEQFRLLVWVFGIAAVLSFLISVGVPSYGIMGRGGMMTLEDTAHVGAWRGAYIHKNTLGGIMVLSGLVFLLFSRSSRRFRWIAWIGFGLSVGLILLSTSKTALVCLLTLILLLPFYKALRWNNSIAVPFFITVILLSGAIAVLLTDNFVVLLDALGRDVTLTGRTDIWAGAIHNVMQHPWLGHGYGVFWEGVRNDLIDVWTVAGGRAKPASAHNGFLDVALDLGLVGLFVFVISLVTVFVRAINWVRLTETPEGFWPLSFLTFMMQTNLTESSFMRPDISWLLFVAITLSLHNRTENLVESNRFWRQKFKMRMEQVAYSGSASE